jgi:hypothetical protein
MDSGVVANGSAVCKGLKRSVIEKLATRISEER